MAAMNAVTLETLTQDQHFDSQLELVQQHWRSVRHLWLDTPDPLRTARLGPDLPPNCWMSAGLPGLATVAKFCDRFEFTDGGRPALIVPAYDGLPSLLDTNAERHVEELRDLVAVDLDHPDRFWRRRGAALVLGNAYLEIANHEDAPVPVFRNPLTWLRAGGAGITILDWNYAWDLLLGFELIAEDVELGTRLEAALAPSILVMEAA